MQSIESLGLLKVAAARRQREMKFWSEKITENIEKSRFPVDRIAVGNEHREIYSEALSDALADRLESSTSGKQLAQQVFIGACTAELARRYTGSSDIVIGHPSIISNLESLPLATWLPIYTTLAPEVSTRELLNVIYKDYGLAVEHQDYPLELLSTGHGDGSNPLFDIAVSVVHSNGDQVSSDTYPPLGVPLHLSLVQAANGPHWKVDFDSRQYTMSTIARLISHMSTLAYEALIAPDVSLSSHALGNAEDAAVIQKANATDAKFNDEIRLDEILSRQVRLTPDAIAVTFLNVKLTYREFDARANQLAHTLRKIGVQPDQLIAVVAQRSIDMMVAIYAVLKAGGAYLPIDPGYPRSRIDYVLQDSGVSTILAHPELLPEMTSSCAIIDLRDPSAYDACSSTPNVIGNAKGVAYAIYTSGSTGNPKGVLIEHRSAINRIEWMQKAYPMGPQDVILQKTPISFDVSVWELFWWSFVGARVALLAPGGEKDPEAIIDAIEQQRVTTIHFVPSMLSAFMEYTEATGAASRMRTLSQVFASGEALGVHQVQHFYALLGRACTRLINLYGPTEATVDVSHHICDPFSPMTTVPIGKPIDNTRLYIVDRQMRLQPVGIPGELCIAGVCLARGYHNRPELTAELFLTNPFKQEARVYRTGDLARWNANGEIEYLGRIDNQVKIRGYRIELGEIEARLRDYPGISDAFVMAIKNKGKDTSLCGYIVNSAKVDIPALKAFVAESVPEYMVPSDFVTMEAFPLSPNGKLDRKALPLPDLKRNSSPVFVTPRNAVEQTLADLWGEVLSLSKIGIHDNFFSLGANSIHFVTFLAKARGHGLLFTFQEVFTNPTIAKLSVLLENAGTSTELIEVQSFDLISESDRIRLPESAEDAYPLSLLQIGLIFQNELTFGTSQYHDILSYIIESSFDSVAFESAVRAVVARNPIFRTSYHLTGYELPLQIVHKDMMLPLEIFDFRLIDPALQEIRFQEWATSERNRRFVWEEPGLVRLQIHILTDNLFRYTLTQHNSALDGWSITLVHTQIFEQYYAAKLNIVDERPPIENYSRHFIALEQASLKSEKDKMFWRGVIEGTPFTQLPRCAQAHGQETLPQVIFHDVDIPKNLSDKILVLAEKLGVPVKTLLMSVHLKVLSVLCASNYVSTGYEQSGRPEHVDATESIGLFLNTVPFGVRIDDDSWETLIRDVFDLESALLPHRRYPMAQIKQDLGTREMLFETAFNYTHFYRLKELKKLPEFSLLDVRANSETEFVVRAEFSRHFFTDDIRLSLHYHDHLFTVAQMESMASLYRRAFELMTENVAAKHQRQTLINSSELSQLKAAGESVHNLDDVDIDNVEAVEVLDAYGLPSPLGVYGELHVRRSGEQTVSPMGVLARWLPSWTLEVGGAVGSQSQRFFGNSDAVRRPIGRRPHTGATFLTVWEKRIAEVWAELLRVPVSDIDLDDDFFSIGGNSLMAIRVVLMLDGAIRLSDLMEAPTVRRLAVIAESQRVGHQSLLVNLLKYEVEVATLICLPYAGGSSASFRPLAEAMRVQAGGIAVYGVELPGHDLVSTGTTLMDIKSTARILSKEIITQISGPIILWGHCIGSALAIELSSILTQSGISVLEVFVGGKLLQPVEEMRASIGAMNRMSNREVVDWMIRETGHKELAELNDSHADRLITLFKHDAETANEYLAQEFISKSPKLNVPLTVVVATDDPLTLHFAQTFQLWGTFANNIRLKTIEGGGHYFCRSRPIEVARVIFERVGHKIAQLPQPDIN